MDFFPNISNQTNNVNTHCYIYKTTLKPNLKNNVTLLSCIAHGFLNILSSDIVNDLNDAHTQRPLPPIESLQQFPLSTINEHPLDESSDNSEDPTNPFTKPSGYFTTTFLYKTSK